MMRMTVGTVAVLVAIALLSTAFWPETGQGPLPMRVQAQKKSKQRNLTGRAGVPGKQGSSVQSRPTATVDENNAATELRLTRRVEAQFLDQPLDEVLDSIRLKYGFQVYVNTKQLEDMGVDLSAPVNINLPRVRVDMLLDLILDQIDLVYTIRDGILIVTTRQDLENALEVRV